MTFEDEVLESHNKYRKIHNVPPLKLNSAISKKSLAYANVLCKKGKMEHSSDSSMGENLYYYMSTNPNAKVTGEMAVKSWYDEIQFYTEFFGREPENSKAGHFTQVVWKATTEFGVGVASKNGKFYVVANYKPPGNFRGQYAVNVLEPSK